MSRSLNGRRLHQIFTALSPTRRLRQPRPGTRRSPSVESLEGRALMATITASGALSSVADGANFDYTIKLTNSASSTSGIGTFWYAWVPGQDFLTSSPISVTPPSGWTDKIMHTAPSDGYSIQFVASIPIDDVEPGGSMNFMFTSADTPAAVNGNSVDFPGMAVGTSVVYPAGPLSDGGHEFVVTQAGTPTPTGPLVSVTNVQTKENRRHMVTQITVDFSGAVNASEADSVATYRLVRAGKKGLFAAKNAMALKLKSAMINAADNAVTLTPRKAFALTMKNVELIVNGLSPGGLQDSSGQLIDGGRTGQPGGNAVVILSPSAPMAPRRPAPPPPSYPGY